MRFTFNKCSVLVFLVANGQPAECRRSCEFCARHGGENIPQRTPGPFSRRTRRQGHADQGERGRVGGDTGEHLQKLGERASAAQSEGRGPVSGSVHGGDTLRSGGGAAGTPHQACVE